MSLSSDNMVGGIVVGVYEGWLVQTGQSSSERTWAMLCHLSALLGFVIPMGQMIGPTLIWLLKRKQFRAVDEHGQLAVRFQGTVTVTGLITLGVLTIPLVIFAKDASNELSEQHIDGNPFPLRAFLFLTVVAAFICIFIAAPAFLAIRNAIRAKAGKPVSYPFEHKLLKIRKR